jgi:thymidylate synthase (FAD)
MYVQAEGREFLRHILQRDSYHCQRCGAPKSGPRSLHVHHIKPWAGNPSLRFDATNAVTLCKTCHDWVHSKANVLGEWLA